MDGRGDRRPVTTRRAAWWLALGWSALVLVFWLGLFVPSMRPERPGVKQEPPLPVTVELARDAAADVRLADAIRARLREALVVTTRVELVPWGSLPRSEYKSKLVDRS